MSGVSGLTSAPILPTIWRLSLPNLLAMVATALVSVAETSYVGQLGTAALAGMALVFPMVMLQQMLSSGAMGGGISSAISRALGAGDDARANDLVLHAVVISLALGLLFTLLVGTSRVYLGVHYPSDVLAGWIAAIVWVGGVFLVAFHGGRKPWQRSTLQDA